MEYTLEGVHKLLGVTTYEHLAALRPGLPDALPSPEELRSEFAEAERDAERAPRPPAGEAEEHDAV